MSSAETLLLGEQPRPLGWLDHWIAAPWPRDSGLQADRDPGGEVVYGSLAYVSHSWRRPGGRCRKTRRQGGDDLGRGAGHGSRRGAAVRGRGRPGRARRRPPRGRRGARQGARGRGQLHRTRRDGRIQLAGGRGLREGAVREARRVGEQRRHPALRGARGDRARGLRARDPRQPDRHFPGHEDRGAGAPRGGRRLHREHLVRCRSRGRLRGHRLRCQQVGGAGHDQS